MVEQVVDVNEVSRIAQGVIIKGDFSSRTDIRVDGQVEGKLYTQGRVVVGESANIKGCIAGNDVDLWGSMDGDIYVRGILTLKSSAVVNGNLWVNKIQMELGAKVNGSWTMISEEQFDKQLDQIIEVKFADNKPAPATAPNPASNQTPNAEKK